MQDRACNINVRAERIKCNANSISQFLVTDMVAFENEDGVFSHYSPQLLWIPGIRGVQRS